MARNCDTRCRNYITYYIALHLGDKMKLKKWMERNHIDISSMAEKLGVDRSSVHKYLDGTRTPRLSIAAKIEEITDGEVTCTELLDVNSA